MSYQEKINTSADRAHTQLVATKIDRGMRELRNLSRSSTSGKRRWVWELLQNAKDVHQDGGVNVRIDYDSTKNTLVFHHSGRPFTADNIRFLIEQISTKDREKDEDGVRKETGKFGTGFLSTHLLSEVVMVSGVAKEPDLDFKRFNLILDRSGQDLPAICAAVTAAKEAMRNLDSLPAFTSYVKNDFNTSFEFNLADNLSHSTATSGIEDLRRCLAYTLTFVPEINSVGLGVQKKIYHCCFDELMEDTNLRLSKIRIGLDGGKEEIISVATITKGLTNVSIPVICSGESVRIGELCKDTPRLFCDFPLVGSEVFPFPAIINNPHFDPTDPRDGIYLTDAERGASSTENNKQIIHTAVELYADFARSAISQNWENLHLLAEVGQLREKVGWVSHEWVQANVINEIRSVVANEKIVTVAAGCEKKAILGPDHLPLVWFPIARNQSVREQIWKLASQWFPSAIPIREHVEAWNRLLWAECGQLTSERFCGFVERENSVAELTGKLGGQDCFTWLNEFYAMLHDDRENTENLTNDRSIFPNQNGVFCQIRTLHLDSGDIGDDFKNILRLFDCDIRNTLLDERLKLPIAVENIIDRSSAIGKINIAAYEKLNNRDTANHFRPALNALLAWFRSNPPMAERDFPALYDQKHLLYDEETMIENTAKAEQLDQFLSDSGVNDLIELKAIIDSIKLDPPNDILPITQAILASLGITSIEEWEDALQDRDLAAMFSHESTPTKETFIFVQALIKKAKKNVIAHLERLPNYDLPGAEETAPTVIAGITKSGRDLQIVIRPAYSGEVIIYYSAERDVLDFDDDAELWVDTEDGQFQVTLGQLLKKTNIHKFPI